MNKNLKIGLGVVAATALAGIVAIPVFKEVKADQLVATDLTASAVQAFQADEDTVEAIVTEESTEEIEKASDESENSVENEAEYTDSENSAGSDTDHYVEYHFSTDEELEAYLEYIDSIDWEYLSEESKNLVFDPNNYDDEELRSIAQEYLDQGYYLTDAEYTATNMLSGTGVPLYDEEGNEIGQRFFTNGFDVVDDENGNNTFYIQVLKITQEDFDMLMEEDFTFDFVDEVESGEENVIRYEYSDDLVSTIVTYNKETGIYILENVFTDAAADAEG